MYEVFESLCEQKGITTYRFCKDTGINSSTISTWKSRNTSCNLKLARAIADYFGVTVDYVMTGKKSEEEDSALTERDKRDISKDLDRIMGEIRKGDNGPLYYNGVEISGASINLLENAIEFALKETKLENKVKYNPYKNKK